LFSIRVVLVEKLEEAAVKPLLEVSLFEILVDADPENTL
jgi:hypothetical protein